MLFGYAFMKITVLYSDILYLIHIILFFLIRISCFVATFSSILMQSGLLLLFFLLSSIPSTILNTNFTFILFEQAHSFDFEFFGLQRINSPFLLFNYLQTFLLRIVESFKLKSEKIQISLVFLETNQNLPLELK